MYLDIPTHSQPIHDKFNGALLLFGIRSLQKLYLAATLYKHCSGTSSTLYTSICGIIDSGNVIRDDQNKFNIDAVEKILQKMVGKSIFQKYKNLEETERKEILSIVCCTNLQLKNGIRYLNELLPVQIGKQEYNSLTSGENLRKESRYRYLLEQPQKFYDKIEIYFAFVIHFAIVCEFSSIPPQSELKAFIDTNIESYLGKYNFDILNSVTPKMNQTKDSIQEYCKYYLNIMLGYRISRTPVYLVKNDTTINVYTVHDVRYEDNNGDPKKDVFHRYCYANAENKCPTIQFTDKKLYVLTPEFQFVDETRQQAPFFTENGKTYVFRYINEEWNYYDTNGVKYTKDGCSYRFKKGKWYYGEEKSWYGYENHKHPLPKCPLPPSRPSDNPIPMTSIQQVLVTFIYFREITTKAVPTDIWKETNRTWVEYRDKKNVMVSENPLFVQYQDIVDLICPCTDKNTNIDTIMSDKSSGILDQLSVMSVVFKDYTIPMYQIFQITKQLLIGMKEFYIFLQNVRHFMSMKS